MYPRNAASPERVYVGVVVQISDGAVQTSGVSITVTPQGGSETAGGGTVAYSTKGGVWYTPTQAETNYTSFLIEASKTGCLPAGVTVVTTASGVAGYAAPDWAAIRAPTTTVNLSGTTIKTATDVETDTADIQSRLPAALVSGRMDSSVGAIATGVDFSATMKASINTEADTALSDVGLTSAVTGRIDVAVSTRLASAGYTAPLDAAGVRAAVGLAGAEVADAILARDLGSGTGAGTLDERTVRSALRAIRNKWTVASGTHTVYKEDDTTTAWTAALSSSASADPVTGSDPT